MRSAVAVLLALANLSLVPAAPSPKLLDESVFEDAGTPTWKITVVEGEPPVEFNGTIQDVMKQLKVDYPEFARKAQEKIDAGIEAQELEDGASSSPEAQALKNLQKRDHNICFNFPVAREQYIRQGIQYLRGISGGLTVRAGPGACDRISCSGNSGIFVCNDNSTPFWIPAWDNVANAAQACNNECRRFCFDCGLQTGWWTSGQRFHDAKFNVIIREQSC
ncbi:serine threonine kinase [Fusarium sporotrichioides]|uniref:Serine threonine kinase n=1 Tax=Fusarium sporotrichioides TaxID=5514 RepID=A0A395RW94_FUSSP|nr:serine threonine kinase [Fusarium sporotrichioides]